jgi:PAS domain S-box-containing protein
MDPIASSPLFWAALALALSACAFGVAMLRLRNRVTRQAAELAHDVESLNDRLWALADSEERYRSLIEAQGDLIVRRDGQRIVYANAAFAALLGLDETQAIGSAAQPTQIAVRPAQALGDGTRVFDECLAGPGGERWISWVETVVPIALSRTVLQRVGRDITARIAGERALDEARARAESASEAKSRFLATVSHEFRTPLNGILGMADLLGDTRLDPEQGTYVGALRTSGEAMLALVDDILDVAKVEAGKLELASEPFDLAALTEAATELMAPRAQAKGLEIATAIAPGLPSRLVGDRDRIRQILLNLVGNAVKFTQAGGVGVTVVRDGGDVVIAVADTGPGIAPDRLEAIFEAFEQADDSATRRHEGTGLGLAIVRRLARLMGGDVSVETRPEQGCVFTVRLPLPAGEGVSAPNPPDWRGRRALVVSPAPFGGRFLCDAITATGATAVVVATPEKASKALSSGRLDAVLIDQSLGSDAVRTLAAMAAKADIGERLIMLAPTERRAFGAPREAGFTGFLIKPVRARSLYERLSPQPQPTLSAPPAEPTPESSPAKPRLTVLVAEDNEINALLATRTLERLGCDAIWARDGRQAVAEVEASLAGTGPAIDLVLLDIRMPELDGLGAARAIRAAEARIGNAAPLPLIAVTANVSGPDRHAALAAGMVDCLAKPLERSALQGWLDRVGRRDGLCRSA